MYDVVCVCSCACNFEINFNIHNSSQLIRDHRYFSQPSLISIVATATVCAVVFHCYACHYLRLENITYILKIHNKCYANLNCATMPKVYARIMRKRVCICVCMRACICVCMRNVIERTNTSTLNYLQYVSWIRSHLHHLIININSLNMWPNFQCMNEGMNDTKHTHTHSKREKEKAYLMKPFSFVPLKQTHTQ